MANKIKLARYEEIIKQVINNALNYEINNKIAKNATVTTVTLTNDLSYAKVYIDCLYRENIAKIIEKLPPNYQEVIKIRYMGSRKLKFQEVADKLGTSRQNIQQIEARALKRIRKMPEAAILEEYL